MHARRGLFFLLLILALSLAACSSQGETAAGEAAVANDPPTGIAIAPTNTPVPETNTPSAPTATTEPPTPTPRPPTPTPQPPTPTPLPEMAAEDLYGRWGQALFTLTLNPDGTYLLEWPAEVGDETPLERGGYVLQKGVLSFMPESYEATGTPTIDGCDDGKRYAYTASFSDGDPRFLKLVVSGSDGCGYRAHQWSQEPVWQLLESFSAE